MSLIMALLGDHSASISGTSAVHLSWNMSKPFVPETLFVKRKVWVLLEACKGVLLMMDRGVHKDNIVAHIRLVMQLLLVILMMVSITVPISGNVTTVRAYTLLTEVPSCHKMNHFQI